MANLYSIEGLGGSGKTVLVKQLFEAGFTAFEEISETISKEERNKKLENMPKELRPRFLNDWYFERELERINTAILKDKIVVFDRSI